MIAMRLAAYMQRKNLTDAKAADKLGVKRETVTRWRNESMKPKHEMIARIAKWSKGAVRFEDWPVSEAAE